MPKTLGRGKVYLKATIAKREPERYTAVTSIEKLKEQRRKALKVIMYCTYGDESRDDTLNRVYAVAGVWGHQEDWDAIAGPWEDRLGGRTFHAADCEFGHREFSDLKSGEGKKIFRDLTELVANSKLFGIGTAINVAEYRETFPLDFEDAPYLWGFGDVLHHVTELTSVALDKEQITEVTFDRNEPIEYNANAMYEWMRVSKKLGRYLGDTLSFACRKTVGIQVADLFAREVMKNLDSRLSDSGRATRLSFVRLRDTKRFIVTSLGKSDFESKKKELSKSSYRDDASLDAYRRWLDANRLKDCLTNRIEHMKNIFKNEI
jgi:hypothetical protein